MPTNEVLIERGRIQRILEISGSIVSAEAIEAIRSGTEWPDFRRQAEARSTAAQSSRQATELAAVTDAPVAAPGTDHGWGEITKRFRGQQAGEESQP